MEQSKFYQIKNVTECEYTLVGCDGSVITRPIQEVDKIASSFTVQDAKDGDVLVCIGKYGQEIGIIKEYVGKHGGCDKCFETYCFVDWDGIFRTGEYMGSKEIHPATKEQRNTLEKAMADAGYTFDFGKKELRKIEQKQDTIIRINPSEYINDMGGNGCYLKNTVQVSTWSEENDNCLSTVISEFSKCSGKSVSKDEWMRCNDWLNSLKDRVQLQPVQEWNGGDDAHIHSIITHLQDFIESHPNTTGADIQGENVAWLKSLRPQSQWKPSDEQIMALRWVLNHIPYDSRKEEISGLLEQLNKLREE